VTVKRQKRRVGAAGAARARARRARPIDQPSIPREAVRPAHVLALAALLVTCGAWAYSTSFSGVFVLDDVRAIARNATIRTIWPLSTPLSPPTASTVAGRPVANLTFALNYALAPPDAREVFDTGSAAASGSARSLVRNAWGYHFLNLLIHLCAALALFGIVRRALSTDRLRPVFGPSAVWLAFVVALIWVVHPLLTGSVTYVVQRVESLMGLFYLLTLYCALRAGERTHAKYPWAAAATLSCALGMATKEAMVTAPVVVWMWHRFFKDRRMRSSLVAGLAATWLVLAALLWHERRAPSIDLSSAILLRYLMTQPAVIVHYLRLALIGSPLVFLYTWPLATSFGEVAWQAAVVVALLVLTVVAAVRRHPAGFAGAWFFLILAPTSSILPIVTEVAAEQRMYLPLAGVAACAVIAVYLLGRAVVGQLGTVWPGARVAALMAGVACVAATAATFAETTRARNRDYWSAEALWADTVTKQPQNERARLAYGTVLSEHGRFAEAAEQFRVSISLDPRDGTAHARLGAILAARGRVDEAIGHWKEALALHPDNVEAQRWLGLGYAMTHQDDLAVPHLERSLERGADDVEVLGRLAAILADSPDAALRNAPKAVLLAERAAALTARSDPRTLDILAVAQAGVGRFRDASATADEALRLARARGNAALVAELEQRVTIYSALARPRR
jgi:Flp pilus assembly protein TadD